MSEDRVSSSTPEKYQLLPTTPSRNPVSASHTRERRSGQTRVRKSTNESERLRDASDETANYCELFCIRRNPSQSLGEAATNGFHGFLCPRARRDGENGPHTPDAAVCICYCVGSVGRRVYVRVRKMPPGTIALGVLWASTSEVAISCPPCPSRTLAPVMMKSYVWTAVAPFEAVRAVVITPVPSRFTV